MIKRFSLAFSLFLMIGMQVYAGPAQSGNAIPPSPIVLLNTGEHLLCGKSRDGKIVFEDGTLFKALESEALRVFQEWEYHEHLEVSPNPYPLGGSSYYLENIERGEFIHVDFYSEPNRDDNYTLTIFHIDPYYGEIYLTNLSGQKQPWKIETKDCHLLEDWEEGDRVFIGKNNNFFQKFRSSCPFILINCEIENAPYVRIKPF